MILLLFTSAFPYDFGGEKTFLSRELDYLKTVFDRVIIIPRTCIGNRLPVPEGIEVDDSYARFLISDRFTGLWRVILSPILYRDIIANPSILLHLDALNRLIKFTEIARLTQSWVEDWLGRYEIQARKCLFYTYWFNDISMGIGSGEASLSGTLPSFAST